MSAESAEAFLDRIEADEAFATELADLRDPEAALARMREAGYDASPDEVKAALLGRYGETLTTEELDSIVAGKSLEQDITTVVIVSAHIVAAAAMVI
jgi:predicted ribosomally synthesized peptide with nif11-like leader